MGFWNLLKEFFIFKWLFGVRKNNEWHSNTASGHNPHIDDRLHPEYDDLDRYIANHNHRSYQHGRHTSSYTDTESYLDDLDDDIQDYLDDDIENDYGSRYPDEFDSFSDFDSPSGFDRSDFFDDYDY